MKQLLKRIACCTLSAAVVISGLPAFSLVSEKSVQAAENALIYSDSRSVDSAVVKDDNLRTALKTIIGGSSTASLTVGQLKAYEGSIDLSGYTNINNIEGLGFALKASSFNLSKLSKLTQIADYEFKDCEATSVKLPTNITSIGKQAFANCYNLSEINIPAKVTSIGEQAFLSCESISNITLPDGLSYLGTQAFAQCTSLQEIVIPNYINAMIESADETEMVGIGESVFYGCTSLSSVTLGDAMTAIPSGMFQGDSALHYINIPDKISSIRSNAFSASGLYAIDLSKTQITKIYDSTFLNCSDMFYLKLPKNLTVIGASAFAHCGMLTDGSVMENCDKLVEIGARAFDKAGFVNLVIPENVKTIGTYAFTECKALESVTVKDFTVIPTDGSITKDFGDYCFKRCFELSDFILPTANQNKLNVNISLGKNMFEECVKLENINFPANIVSIGNYAFYKCGLHTTDFEKTDYPFVFLNKKKGITYYVTEEEVALIQDENHPNKVWAYSVDLGSDYYNVREVYVNLDTLRTKNFIEAKRIVIEDINGNNNMHQEHFFGLKSVDLSGCTRLETFGTHAFDSCKSLQTVYLPDNLTEIPEYAFANCGSERYMGNGNRITSLGIETVYDEDYYGLKYVKMDNVEVIGKGAFTNCYNLSLDSGLPANIKRIMSDAFKFVYGINTLVLPESLEYIGDSAFSSTSRNVDDEVFMVGLTSLDARKAKNLAYVGSGAFSYTAIDKLQFYVDAPLEYIGDSAFYSCQYLTNAQMPKKLKVLPSKVFGLCIRLRSINVYDKCTINANLVQGGMKIKHLKYSDESFFGVEASSGLSEDFIYTTYQFVLKVDPVDTKLDFRLNEDENLPFELISKSDVNASYSEIKIGDYSYEYDPTVEGRFFGSGAVVTPSHAVASTKYNRGGSQQTKDYVTVSLHGNEVADNVSLKAVASFKFALYGSTVYSCSTSVDYKINVVEVKCTDIKTDDEVYLPVSTTETNGAKVTVKPVFYPLDDNGATLITAIPEWKIESGADLITLIPSADGKTAEIKGKNQYGTAKVKVTAGGTSKEFYVYITDKANGNTAYFGEKKISSGGKADLIIGDEALLTFNTTYSQSEPHPEGVRISSSDENIITVEDVQTDNFTTTAKIKGVNTGTATIIIKKLASNSEYKINVVVSAAGLELTLTDSDENKLVNNANIDLVNKNSYAIRYSLNRELSDSTIKAVMSDADKDVISCSINSSTKIVTVTGKKMGTAKVKLYPNATDESYAVTLIFNIKADVSNVSLSNPSLNIGQSSNIIMSVKNMFNQNVDVNKGGDYKTITDNKFVFTSENPSCVTVNSKGVVKAVKKPASGDSVNVTCTVYRDDTVIAKYSATVKVVTPKMTDFTVTGKTTIYVGQTATLRIAPNPADCNAKINGVATLGYDEVSYSDTTVVIKGKKAGLDKISINVKDDNGIQLYKVIEIRVKPVMKSSAKASLKKPVSGKKKVTLKWKKVTGAQGYILQMSTKKKSGFKTVKKVKSGSKLKYVKKKLETGKIYYFRIQAYGGTSSGKTIKTKWSKVKKVKVK